MRREGMYCSSCGSAMAAGRSECEVCGATGGLVPAVSDFPTPGPPLSGRPAGALMTCVRCGYRGEGLRYFSSGRHVAALILAALVTSWMMGIGGLFYYLMRRDHRVCPRCGQSWGAATGWAMEAAPVSSPGSPVTVPPESSKRGWSYLLFLLAAIFLVAAVAELEVVALLLGAVTGAGGYLLYQSAEREREDRRRALLAWLQLPVLQLAERNHGILTVTQVSAQLGWPLPRAEKVLQSLDDGFRVNSEVTDEGLIVYEFREIIGAERRLHGPGGSA
jgi:hypothetical protein